MSLLISLSILYLWLNTNFIKYLTIFGWSKSPSSALFSITIACYCSIKRLALENLSSPNLGHLLNAIGISLAIGENR